MCYKDTSINTSINAHIHSISSIYRTIDIPQVYINIYIEKKNSGSTYRQANPKIIPLQ